jgi:predicted transposase YbfD/YdcC
LSSLDLKAAAMTIDAMGCQKAIADKLVTAQAGPASNTVTI